MYIDGKILEYPQAKRITKNNGDPMDIQLMILETFDTYPRKVAIQFIDKKIELLSQVNYNPVRVHINPESRNSGDNWFTSLNGWKIEPMPMAAQAGAPQNAAVASGYAAQAPQAAAPGQPAPPQYKIGDVVNGHILTAQGWVVAQNIPQPITNVPQPITQPSTAPAPPPAQPAQPPTPQVLQPAPAWGATPAATPPPAPAPTPVQQRAAPSAAAPPANPGGKMFDANGNIISDPRELF